MTAKLLTPGRIVAIDLADARLEKARAFGADVTVKLNGAVTAKMQNGKYASGPFALQYGPGVQGATEPGVGRTIRRHSNVRSHPMP